LSTNTHTFTGSLNVTGALAVTTTGVEFQVTNTGVNLGNALTDSHIISGSVRINPNGLFVTSSGNVGVGTIIPSTALHVVGTTTINGDDGSLYQRAVTANAAVYWDIRNSSNTRRAYVGFGGTASTLFDIANSDGGDIRFTSAGSERMRVTSAGNVGIGTSSPNGNLEVAASTPTLVMGASTAGSLHGIEFRQNNTIDAYIKQLPATGEFKFYVGRNSSWGGNMTFWTDTVQRMFISSGGVIVMGTTSTNSSGATLQVEGTGNFGPLSLRFANAASGRLWKVGPDNTNNFIIYNENNTGTYLGYSGTSWTGNSDIRLKNIINPITDAISKLSELNPIIFSWKSDETNKENLGLVAQDVEKVFPQVIDINSEGMLGIRYSELTPVLVKAIQELTARVQELENK
jgi:hypothetical protein